MLHRFLPPVDVDVSVGLGGTATERVLVLAVKCVVPPGMLMVVDHKGRITHATTGLAALLGFPLRQLVGMDVASLIPPPYSQLHAGFYKVREREHVVYLGKGMFASVWGCCWH
jgi:hypothetical protein